MDNILKKGKKGYKKVQKSNQIQRVLGFTKAPNENDKGMGGIAQKTFEKSVMEQNRIDDDNKKARKKKKKKEKKENRLLNSIEDPFDISQVGRLVCQRIRQLPVDPRTIGGSLMNTKERSEDHANILLHDSSQSKKKDGNTLDKKLQNECLFCLLISRFEIVGGDSNQTSTLLLPGARKVAKKAKNKLRYLCIIRSTNHLLLTNESGNPQNSDDEAEDEDADYDTMFKPDSDSDDNSKKENGANKISFFDLASKLKATVDPNMEISSFPSIVFLALHADGTSPDFRRIISLEKLVTIVAHGSSDPMANDRHTHQVTLGFKSGESVTIDLHKSGNKLSSKKDNIRTDCFVWTLLQIHALLCTSVVERHLATSSNSNSNALPFLLTKNIDKAELQYSSTVNGFLSDNQTLCELLERQRNRAQEANANAEVDATDNADVMAYDMMMGNHSRYTIITSPEEEAYAVEILNYTSWQDESDGSEFDPTYISESLTSLLQKKMRELESETCRRLIAWEDERSSTSKQKRDCADTLSLIKLSETLENLDTDLANMERYLNSRSEAIAPLTRDCHEIEEENRQLEQQLKSFGLINEELTRILKGLELDPEIEEVLKNPKKYLYLENNETEDGLERIQNAGNALVSALKLANQNKCVYIKAIYNQVDHLLSLSQEFCCTIARLAVGMMESLAADVIGDLEHGKITWEDSHTTMVTKMRETQRLFQEELLPCFNMVEMLHDLHPELLIAMRDAYSKLVESGILKKRRLKKYFSSLPTQRDSTSVVITMDLKDYHPVVLGSNKNDTSYLVPVNAEDVQLSLKELLPIITREAYFTAHIFGPHREKELTGREKKRNFEATKKCVDKSCKWIRYYTHRTCGIPRDVDSLGKVIRENTVENMVGDPMLALISSIHLNEAMERFIDKEKKGGIQSLSMAYVRATLFDLRKKVDKVWLSWVENQIRWIKTNHGVPANGKRAGVFDSFQRFPAYLDHVVICCKKDDYTPNISKIKFASFYLQKMAGELFASLHECAERETTDQQYAANVMRMENSYFFSQTIKQRGTQMATLFEKQINAANTICKTSTNAYLGWMIKREFKQLHQMFTNISHIRKDVGDADVPIHIRKDVFTKTLAKESNQDILKEKIKAIHSRMGKHLSNTSALLPVAWKALVKVLYEWFQSWEKVSTQCYGHTLEPSAIQVVRIAKDAANVIQKTMISSIKM